MPSSVKISAQAWRSIEGIAGYLTLKASLRTARRFLQSFQKACSDFLRFPQLGASWQSTNPKLQDLKFWALSRPFQRYLVFYKITHDEIEIIEVMHGSRDAEARLPELE